MRKLNMSSVILKGNKSEPNPSAQIIKLCDGGMVAETQMGKYDDVVKKLKDVNIKLWVLVRILFDNGLRISECLNIKGTDISFNYQVKVFGLKGSSDRLINCSEFKDVLKLYRGSFVLVFNEFNRYYIYRVLKKYGLCHTYSGNVRASVTHQGRHLMGQSVRLIEGGDVSVSQALGHRNENNAKYYVKEK